MATKDKLVNLEDLKSVYDHGMDLLDEKANQVGEYVDLIAGTADNLLSSSYQTDKTPYIFRRTPYGAREKGSIVGGSIVWNQLLQPLNSNDWRAESGVTATYTDGVATVSSTTANNGIFHLSYLNVQLHKYLITFDANCASGLTISLSVVSGAQGMAVSGNGTGSWTRYSAVVNCTGGVGSRRTYLLARGSAYENVMFRNAMLIDLTLMFGPTIADYIYTQEQATAGAGVALAKAWAGITADYIPYDTGSIKSVTGLTAHKMVGFNQWDEEWELGYWKLGNKISTPSNIRSKNKIPILPNTTYYCNKAFYFTYYDENGDFLPQSDYDAQGRYQIVGASAFTTPSNAYYMTFNMGSTYGTTYNNDICINLSDPQRNGQYEPYKTHSYALDSSLTLRGLLKLDGDNLYYDGDIYKADGTVERKYGVVDLGTLAWTKVKASATNIVYFQSTALSGVIKKPTLAGDVANILSTHFFPVAWSSATTDTGAMAVSPSGQISCQWHPFDEYTTEQFKTAMSGVYLVYELATPTTETAEPYTALQICDPNGTEEWVGASMPVGHDTKYYADLKGKIEGIPDAPSADGTYTLKVTVSNGVATYSWE